MYRYQSQGNPYTKTTDIVASSDSTVPSEIRLFTRTSGSATIDERLRINSSGSVGIGTTSPSASILLDVSGSVRVSGNILPGTNNTYTLGAFGNSFSSLYAAQGVITGIYTFSIRSTNQGGVSISSNNANK